MLLQQARKWQLCLLESEWTFASFRTTHKAVFRRRSLTVRRGGEVVQRETTEASGLQSGPPETSGERKGPREEFLEGRRHEQPYRVRRMPEMVVGDRGKWAQLDYMERLLVSTPPLSLSSLPTPAQLWRKRKSIQR